MMRVVINKNHIIVLIHELKPALHSSEGFKCCFDLIHTHTTNMSGYGSSHSIFYIMKTGDTEPDSFCLTTKANQVKLKKSAMCSNVAGKKLSPAHAINMFGQVGNATCQLFGN